MSISQKIVFFGTEDYSLGSLKALVDSGFSVAAVVTKPDAPKGRGQKMSEPPVKTYAKEHGIDVWQPTRLGDIAADIQALSPVTGVLVAYGKIIPQSIIDLFTPGIVNVHPSLLPRWRGPSPIEATIANQDAETGVTIMQLEAGMDSGPIYRQEKKTLEGTESKWDLYNNLFSVGNSLLVHSLPDIISGKLQPTPQDHSSATYCQMLSKNMSLIEPSAMTAAEADAHVRAYLGFPRSRAIIHGNDLIITRAHTSQTNESVLALECKDGNFLVIDELIAPSGKTMSAEAFTRGYLPYSN